MSKNALLRFETGLRKTFGERIEALTPAELEAINTAEEMVSTKAFIKVRRCRLRCFHVDLPLTSSIRARRAKRVRRRRRRRRKKKTRRRRLSQPRQRPRPPPPPTPRNRTLRAIDIVSPVPWLHTLVYVIVCATIDAPGAQAGRSTTCVAGRLRDGDLLTKHPKHHAVVRWILPLWDR
mgnify:CR=1 FL=1